MLSVFEENKGSRSSSRRRAVRGRRYRAGGQGDKKTARRPNKPAVLFERALRNPRAAVLAGRHRIVVPMKMAHRSSAPQGN